MPTSLKMPCKWQDVNFVDLSYFTCKAMISTCLAKAFDVLVGFRGVTSFYEAQNAHKSILFTAYNIKKSS